MSLFDLPPEITEFETSDEPIVVVNHEGVVVLFNQHAEKLFEVEAGDIVGEYVEMLVPEGMQWGHQAYRRGYIAEPNDREMDPGLDPHLQRPDGTLIPIAVRLEPRRVDGMLYTAAHVHQRDGS
jgi:PAS domain S-box-containing protein